MNLIFVENFIIIKPVIRQVSQIICEKNKRIHTIEFLNVGYTQ